MSPFAARDCPICHRHTLHDRLLENPFVIPGSYLYLHTVLTLVPLSSQPNVLSDLSCRLYVPLHPLNNFISGKDNVLKLYINDSA